MFITPYLKGEKFHTLCIPKHFFNIWKNSVTFIFLYSVIARSKKQ